MGYADYSKATGSGGRLMIRVYDWNDPGNPDLVQFFVQAGNSATWANGKTWSWGASNGAGGSGIFNYSGSSGLLHLGNIYVGTTMRVTLAIGATGTTGLGGPTSFDLDIWRPTVPTAPTPLGLDEITPTSMRYRFSGNSDGGLPMLEWQITYGTDPNAGQLYPSSNGTSTLTGLLPATEYYFWSRGRNARGWGPWSYRISAKTLAAARIRVNGSWRYATPYVKVEGVWRMALPLVKVGGAWKNTG